MIPSCSSPPRWWRSPSRGCSCRCCGAARRGVAREASNVAILRDQLRELDADLATGTMPRDRYEQARRELEQRAFEESQRVRQRRGARPRNRRRGRPRSSPARSPSRRCCSMSRSATTTHSRRSRAQRATAAPSTRSRAQEIEAMAAKLAARLEKRARQRRGWVMLARTYYALNRHADAARAFDRAMALIPDNADLLADYADALGAAEGGLRGKSLELIERALKADPTHWKALALAGTAAFNRKDYKSAVAYWERMKATVPPASPLAGSIDASIAEARELGGLKADGGRTASPPATGDAEAAPLRRPLPRAAAAHGATIAGTVSLAPALAAQGGADGHRVHLRARGRGPEDAARDPAEAGEGSARSPSRSTTRWRWRRTSRCRTSLRSSSARACRNRETPRRRAATSKGSRRRSRSARQASPSSSTARCPDLVGEDAVDEHARQHRCRRASSSAPGFPGSRSAFDLQRRGLAVEVLDAGSAAGGVIGTIHRDGALYETGPNSALDSTPLINELLDALGIRDERIEANAVAATRYIVRDGRLVPLPTSPGAFLMQLGVHAGRQVPPLARTVRRAGAARRRGIVAAFARRRLGDRVSRLRDRPVRRGCLLPGIRSGSRSPPRFPALHALEQKYGSLIRGQIRRRANAGEAAGKAANRGRQLLVPQRHADADRRARAGGARVTTGVSIGRLERMPTAVGPDRHAGRRTLRAAREKRRACGSGVRGGHLVRALAPAAAQGARRDPLRDARDRRHRLSPCRHRASARGFRFPRPEAGAAKDPGVALLEQHVRGPRPGETVLLTSFVGGVRHPELPAGPDAELAAIVHGELPALVGAAAIRSGPRSPAGPTRFRNTISAIASGCARSRTRSARCPGFGSAPTIAAAFRSATASSRRTRRRMP